MKRLFLASLFISLFLLIACSDNNKRTIELSLSDIQKTAAISRAKDFMLSEGVSETNSEWGTTGVITEAYPVYLDGVEEVSYYECKVVRNGQDAGYILVNVNETDVPFPQYSVEGKTPSEEFSQQSGYSIEQLKVYRNNWFEMFATSNKSSLRGETDEIIISRGMDEYGSGEFIKGDNSFVRGKRADFRQRVLSSDTVNPLYQREALRSLHRKDSFDSKQTGKVDHFGAIEGVKYMEKKVLIWLNYEMWYLVNYGWSNKREWVCVDAQYGSNAPERKNTGNLYFR